MKKYTIRNPFSRDFENVKPEKFTDPSLTVPDQSMTIKEIQIRFASGIPMSNSNQIPVYNGEEDFWEGKDPRTLDIVEVNEIIKQRVEELKQTRNRVEQDVKKRREEAEKMRADKEAKEIAEAIQRREEAIDKLMKERKWPQQPEQPQ